MRDLFYDGWMLRTWVLVVGFIMLILGAAAVVGFGANAIFQNDCHRWGVKTSYNVDYDSAGPTCFVKLENGRVVDRDTLRNTKELP